MTDKPNGSRIRRVATNFRYWAALVTAVFVLYQVAPAVGLSLPRWVWKSEFDRHAREVEYKIKAIKIRTDIGLEAIRTLNRNFLREALFRARERKKDMEDMGKTVPSSLRQRIFNLENQIKDAK